MIKNHVSKVKSNIRKLMALGKLKAVDGLYKVKKWVEEQGLKPSAVTNAPRVNAELMISALRLTDFFDVLITGNECEHPKPHPDPYSKAVEALKVSKDHTFVFQDSVSGIKAGAAAGMPVVGIITGNRAHLLIEAKPAFLIKDYNDLKLQADMQELDKQEDNPSGKVDAYGLEMTYLWLS